MNTDERDRIAELGQQLRVDAVRASAEAGSGHPTSSMSAADLIATLIARHLRYQVDEPDNPTNDRVIFSKGHASPLYYGMLRAMGAIDAEELSTYRKFGSRLEGHPTPVLPWVEVATGSLGQGLPIGVGMALTARDLDRLPYRVWVLCGDSELAEGSIWEALEHAGSTGLDNLKVIVDVNRLGQRGETRHGWDLSAWERRIAAFDCHVIQIDGHDVDAIDAALTSAAEFTEGPTVILARTKKGKGVKSVEDQPGKHGKPVPDAEEAIAELGGGGDAVVAVAEPPAGEPHRFESESIEPPRYSAEDEVPTRKAFAEALTALGSRRGDVVVLDGEVGNSTYTELFGEAHPERFFQMFIAEQLMAGVAVGMSRRGWTPFCATFAAFWTRAYDFIRMAAVSRVNLRLSGSHAGVAIGEDGPSQMGLEDVAAMRAIHGSTVLHPSDPNQTARLVEAMADLEGISYLRTMRSAKPTIYGPDEEFPVGGSRTLRTGDDVTIAAMGITVHEALAAADQLSADGIGARVIDCYSIKPIDATALAEAVAATGGVLITVEDHWAQGGLGDAVLAALAEAGQPVSRYTRLAVREMPRSGKPAALLDAAGIDAAHIADAARASVGAAATHA
jgi:transketolase